MQVVSQQRNDAGGINRFIKTVQSGFTDNHIELWMLGKTQLMMEVIVCLFLSYAE